MEEVEEEPNFDVPQSREDKPEAYPNGPITIYESGVDLFYEPNAEIASRYDVIMNVASEVKNPFEVAAQSASLLGSNASAQILQDRPLMSTTVGVLSGDAQQTESPDTPKATPIEPSTLISSTLPAPASSRPEYIHIPWEHNTDIVPDLYKLVTVIDERVQQKKRVLVHCQCGVSRSASLIVAYGLYKNPGMSVQEAYDAVKARSKWIGPNMSLIMQLQEFHSGLEQARRDPSFRHKVFGAGTPRGLMPRISPAMSATVRGPFESRLTPGPRPLRISTARNGDVSPQRASTGDIGPSSAGPVPRGQGTLWDSSFRRSWGAGETSFNINDVSPPPIPSITSSFVDPAGHIVPQVNVTSNPTSSPPLDFTPPHAARKVPNFSRPTPERQLSGEYFPRQKAAPVPIDVESSLMSPRSTEFGMVALTTPKEDSLNILSPMAASFPTLRPVSAQSDHKGFWQEQIAPSSSPLSPISTSFPEFPLIVNKAPSQQIEAARVGDFGMHSIHQAPTEDIGIFSPMSASFPSLPTPTHTETQTAFIQTPEQEPSLETPRSANFHMTAFSNIPSGDDFGILSPVATSFPSNPFENSPFANISINDTPSPPSIPRSSPPPAYVIQRSKTPTPSRPAPWGETDTPRAAASQSPDSRLSKLTPSPPVRRLRAKFSSPSMREQIRLQELQTEIAKTLPTQKEDLDALMSPRAGEFTSNPFHSERPIVKTDLPHSDPMDVDIKVEHNIGPIKDEPVRKHVSEADPRSPAQIGISPIVRNIWDVLE